MWEIRGDAEFLRYLIGNQQNENVNEKRNPECMRIYNFLPQQIADSNSTNGGEMSFFDALIKVINFLPFLNKFNFSMQRMTKILANLSNILT